MPYGLKDIELAKLNEVFAANARIERVVLYGSRAKGNYKPFSDVDIALEGAELTHNDLSRLSLAIDDLLLPYQFDISIFHTLKNEALIDHIRRMGITIYEKKSEWKEYKLGEIVVFGNGKERPKAKGYVPVYGGNGILDYTSEYNYDGETVIIGRVGAYCGSVYYADCPIWVSDNALAVKAKDNNSPKFLYYFLRNLKLNDFAEGSSHPLVTQRLLNSIDIRFPNDVKEQKTIAAILSSLDDKIDLLHRENATLEQMAETLFRQWFVVEAKEEWEEVALGDVVKTTSGGTPTRKISEYYENGTINWVKSKELDGSFISSTEELITEEAVANSSAKMLPEKSVLIAMYGATVGEYGILSKPMTCNQAVCALIPNENYPYTYLFVWTALMKEDFINLASGAAQQNISQDLIKQQIVCSDLDRIKQYDKMVIGYFEKMENNQKQIQTLIQTRDGLLPRLMGGEVKL